MSKLPVPQLRQGPAGPLPPEHKRFNSLLARIEKARALLQTWQEQVPLALALYAKEVQPLIDECEANERAWLSEMDAVLMQPGLSNTDQKTLRGLVLEMAQELIESGPEDDVPALKEIYNHHSENGYDEDQRLELEAMRQSLEEAMEIDLSDVQAQSEDELLYKARAKWAQQAGAAHGQPDGPNAHANADANAHRKAHAEFDDMEDPFEAAPAKKPKRLSKAQQQREAEAQQAKQTAREVYRKLASALHPDRAVDDADRSRRTALMQRVNQAYERDDLLALLSLQLEIEQVDAAHLAQQTAARVRQFNAVLAEQLAELEAAILEREERFCLAVEYEPEQRLNPLRLHSVIGDAKRDLNMLLYTLERKRMALRDKASTKRWLKQERAQQRMDFMDDFSF